MLLNSRENSAPLRFAMIGNGSWATALTKVLLNTQDQLQWFVRDPKMINYIKIFNRNPDFLRSAQLDTTRLAMSDDINTVVRDADVLVMCIPAVFLKGELNKLAESLEGKFIVTAIKGMIPDDNLTVAEYFNRKYNIPYDNIGTITGPCHAEEVSLERLSYLTFSCKKIENAEYLAEQFACSYIKTRVCTDIYGVEYAAILKNIYAVVMGICHSLGYGDNFLAVLVTNAQGEMERFLNWTYHSDARNMTQSSYMGDLLVTCYSQFSRNRTFGGMIGKGYSVIAAQTEMNMIAEGYYACKSIHDINLQHEVDMPIAETLYRILYENASPFKEMKALSEVLQ
ncbi:MAG: NAD(P)-binding domain-containing protein [Bacteroidales bacterium]|nr:NAD(P)-binding domain-containing protein [Bacteroidales bacterium]MCL2132908.1 NAD(P)-binding domain-containing protein [Bacteroidales bacterium]